MSQIVVKMLQVPSVTLDGEPIAFPFRRVEALLYYMLCRKSTTRREVVAILWESCSDETGYKNLRHAIYVLKKCLGVDLLISPQKSMLQLNPEVEVDCDYVRFVEQEDFSAYQGAFLQSFAVKDAVSYEEWIERTREKLRQQYLHRLSSLAAEAEQAGRLDQAERYTLDYLQEDPLDERMAVMLMQEYRRSTQYPKVAQVYQKLRQSFADELGISPLAETTALYYEIMNEWNDTAAEGESSQPDEPPIGREEVLSQLQSEYRAFLLARASSGALLLTGEDGAGKSHLLSYFLRHIDLQEPLVLSTACYQSEQGAPLAAWDAVMVAVAQGLHAEGISIPAQTLAAVSQAFPVLSGGAEPARREYSLSRAVCDGVLLLLSALGRRRRLLLIVEDLHWIDNAGLTLLDAVLRRLGGGSLLLLCTCRSPMPAAVERFAYAARQDQLLRELPLEGLTAQDTTKFLHRELGEALTPGAASRVFEETLGNPMLLCEVVKGAREYGSTEALLTSSRNLLSQRLNGLSAQARQLADLISLFWQMAPCEILCEITGRDETELLAAAEELQQRGLIAEQSGEGGGALAFTHPQLRELVYQQQSYLKRKPLHLRAARLLEQRAGEDGDAALYEQLAYHFAQAGETSDAFFYEVLLLELNTALHCEPLPIISGRGEEGASFDFSQIEQDLARLEGQLAALRRLRGDTARLDRLEALLFLSRGRCELFAGEYDAGMATLDRLPKQAALRRDPAVLQVGCRIGAAYAMQRGDWARAERAVTALSQLLERSPSPAGRAIYDQLRGTLYASTAEFDKSTYYLLEAVDAFSRLPDADRYRLQFAGVYHGLGEVKRQQRGFAAACVEYKKALALVEQCGPLPGAVRFYTDYARAALALGDTARARELFAMGCTLAERTGELAGRAVACAFDAQLRAGSEDYEGAAARLVEAQEFARRLASPLEEGLVCCVMAQIRQKLDMERRHQNVLDTLLSCSLEDYCRRGLRLLSTIPRVFELDALNASLRYGISKQRPYAVPELYSKNKRFMTE